MTIGGYHVFRRGMRVSCDWHWWDHTICEQFHPSLTSWILLGTVVVFTLFHLRVRVAVQHQKIFTAASRYKRILFVPWNKNLLKWKIIIKCVRFIKLLKQNVSGYYIKISGLILILYNIIPELYEYYCCFVVISLLFHLFVTSGLSLPCGFIRIVYIMNMDGEERGAREEDNDYVFAIFFY